MELKFSKWTDRPLELAAKKDCHHLRGEWAKQKLPPLCREDLYIQKPFTVHPANIVDFSLIKNPGGRSWITEKIGLPSGTRAMEKYRVGGWALPLWKMMEFVSWDETTFPIYGTVIWKNKHVPNHQPAGDFHVPCVISKGIAILSRPLVICGRSVKPPMLKQPCIFPRLRNQVSRHFLLGPWPHEKGETYTLRRCRKRVGEICHWRMLATFYKLSTHDKGWHETHLGCGIWWQHPMCPIWKWFFQQKS